MHPVKISRKLLFFSLALLSLGFVAASSSGITHVTAQLSPAEVGISVPDDLIFRNVTSGYISEKESFELKNTGTVDITIKVSLDNSYSGGILTNLKFARLSSDTPVGLNNFSVQIAKPSSVGGERSQTIYAYLDLTKYDGNLIQGKNESADIIFTAVPS
jgi:hypothetical protein